MDVVFIYSKDGQIEILALDAEPSHNSLVNNGWKHISTIKASVYLKYLYLAKDDEIIASIRSLDKS